MGETSIEWTNKTWNPTRGCSIVSPGCTNCYAMGQAHRFSGKGKPFEGLTKKRVKLGVVWTGKVRLVPDMLALPLSWKKPQRVFVNSMSDLFHEGLSNEEIAAVFGVMAATPRHTYQVLTKRAKRMREWFEWAKSSATWRETRCENIAAGMRDYAEKKIPKLKARAPWTSEWLERAWPLPNVWLGVSAEDQSNANARVPELLRTPAAVRFVSYEPGLGPVDFREWLAIPEETDDLQDDPLAAFLLHQAMREGNADAKRAISWIICGGESGPRARPFYVGWAKDVIEQCKRANVACFVKQLGAYVRHDGIQGAGDWWPEQGSSFAEFEGPMDQPAGFRKHLKDKKGGDMKEWPPSLRVRQFPDAHP